MEKFINERKYLHNVSPKTIMWYRDSFKAFENATQTLDQVKQRIMELRERGVKPVSVNTWLRCIKAFYLWRGDKWDLPKLKEENKILATLTTHDILKIISYRPTGTHLTRAHMVTLLILDCGLRISETLGLCKKDINLEMLTVKVIGKGGKDRLVPISKELRSRFYRYMTHNKHENLFPTRFGGKVSIRNIERDFKTLFEKAGVEGIRASPHTLRHTFAVMYLRNGGNLEFLRRILGHSSLVTTQKYLRSLGVADLGAVHSSFSPLARR
jgi:site-specific recombinase XerD